MRTLVLQRDSNQRHAMVEVLRGRGHVVLCVDELEAALSAVAETPFDLVIVDLALERFSIEDLCRRLRATHNGAWCVIVVIPVSNRPHDVEAALRVGIDDYLMRHR